MNVGSLSGVPTAVNTIGDAGDRHDFDRCHGGDVPTVPTSSTKPGDGQELAMAEVPPVSPLSPQGGLVLTAAGASILAVNKVGPVIAVNELLIPSMDTRPSFSQFVAWPLPGNSPQGAAGIGWAIRGQLGKF